MGFPGPCRGIPGSLDSEMPSLRILSMRTGCMLRLRASARCPRRFRTPLASFVGFCVQLCAGARVVDGMRSCALIGHVSLSVMHVNVHTSARERVRVCRHACVCARMHTLIRARVGALKHVLLCLFLCFFVS